MKNHGAHGIWAGPGPLARDYAIAQLFRFYCVGMELVCQCIQHLFASSYLSVSPPPCLSVSLCPLCLVGFPPLCMAASPFSPLPPGGDTVPIWSLQASFTHSQPLCTGLGALCTGLGCGEGASKISQNGKYVLVQYGYLAESRSDASFRDSICPAAAVSAKEIAFLSTRR